MHTNPEADVVVSGAAHTPKARDTTRRLLDSAMRAFGAHGYDSATVSEIARDCGLTVGAVYARWPTKLDLFRAAIEEAARRRLLLTVKDAEATALQKLRELGVWLLDSGRADVLDLWTEACVNTNRHDSLRPAIARFQATGTEELTNIVEEGKEAGEIDPSWDTWAIVFLWQSLSLGAHLVLRVQGIDRPRPSEASWNALIEGLIDAIR